MKFSKNRNIFVFLKTKKIFQKLNYLKSIEFLKICEKFENFKNRVDSFCKSKFSIKNLKNDPLRNNCPQMEIAFTLSPDAHTQPKSNFNT